jgi:UDP-hydrolysing UDP-N-acetyl-D-glucosamine 2-epimerase
LKRVLVAIGSRANYGSIQSAMRAIKRHSNLSLNVLLYASGVVNRYGNLKEQMTKDGLSPDYLINTKLDGDSVRAMAESTGIALLQIPTVMESLKPDFVITIGDRYETIATAISASYMNIPLVHTMGGEVTGTIDESVRHAISKLSHIHFTATQGAKENLVRMGEESSRVFMTGCPRLDLAKEAKGLALPSLQLRALESGIGDEIDFSEDFLILSQHPVTSEALDASSQIYNSLQAVEKLNMQTIVLWPNADAGSEKISKTIRSWGNENKRRRVRFYRNLPPELYLKLMDLTVCMVGNSSSAIREGSFLGTPAVNVGSRQSGREHGSNVSFVGNSAKDIEIAIRNQVTHGKYKSEHIYGDGFAGVRMANELATLDGVNTQKQLKFIW